MEQQLLYTKSQRSQSIPFTTQRSQKDSIKRKNSLLRTHSINLEFHTYTRHNKTEINSDTNQETKESRHMAPPGNTDSKEKKQTKTLSGTPFIPI